MPTLFSQFRRTPGAVALTLAATMVLSSIPHTARADDPPEPAPVNANLPSSNATPVGLGMPDTGGAASVGELASVDPSTGVLRVTYPFELVPARGKLQPSLALSYSSSSGDGDAAWGWTTSTPSIERKSAADTASPAYDDVSWDPSHEAAQQIGTDHFFYAGEALVPICLFGGSQPCAITPGGTSASDPFTAKFSGWYYFRAQVEHGPSTAFLWSPNHTTWLALQANGAWQEFGFPVDAQAQLARNAGFVTDALRDGEQPIYRWNLVLAHDAYRTGNQNPSNPVVYLWDGAQLTDIYDTPLDPDNTSLDGFAHHTKLVYEPFFVAHPSLRPWRSSPLQRLKTVDVTSQDMGGGKRSQVRRYHLHYALENGHWNHEHLTSISAEGRCADSSANSLDTRTVFEGADGSLPEVTNCTPYPATSFTYSTTAIQPDTTVHSMSGITPDLTGPPVQWCSNPASGSYPSCVTGCPTGTGPDLTGCQTLGDGTQVCRCYQSREQFGSYLDVNNDGLPDLVMAPSSADYTSALVQRVCINKAFSRFDCSGTITIPNKVGSVDEKTLLPRDRHVTVGDFLGNGGANLLWAEDPPAIDEQVPSSFQQDYAIYSPVAVAGTPNFQWLGQVDGSWNWKPPAGAPINLNLFQETVTASADLDGDGLTDQLVFRKGVALSPSGTPKNPPTGYNVYGIAFTKRSASGEITVFNRARAPLTLPLGAQDLRAVYRTGAPISAILPAPASQIEAEREAAGKRPFASAPFEVADMNGDGLVDVVAATAGLPVRYWPGYGDGTFGNVTCEKHDVLEDGKTVSVESCRDIVAGGPSATIELPILPGLDPAEAQMTFHDVNGDGYADMIVATPSAIDVYANQKGTALTPYLHVDAGQLGPFWGPDSKVTFADLNGSGTDDIVVANHGVGYLDPTGGEKPGLLTGITNVNGVFTTISYASAAQLEQTQVQVWQKHSPQSLHVVTKVETNNGLAAPHRISRETQYTYIDPAFDARSHQFRGFERVILYHPGDDIGPGSVTEQDYLLAECPHRAGTACPPSVDHPYDALRGLVVSSTLSEAESSLVRGKTVSSTHSVYQVRQVAQGSDGRTVRLVYPEQSDSFIFDTNVATAPTTTSVNDVHALDADDQAVLGRASSVPTDGTGAFVHLRTSSVLDDWGRATKSIDYGRIDTTPDAPIVSTSAWYTPPGAVLGLVSAVQQTNVGAADAAGNLIDAGRGKTYAHTPAGDVLDVTAVLSGMVPFTRAVPLPASASTGGVVNVLHVDRDPSYGIALHTTRPNGRDESDSYDAFHQFVTTKSVRTGTGQSLDALVTQTTFDRGLGKVVAALDPSGALMTMTYDGIGRLTKTTKPSATLLGITTDSLKTEYQAPGFDGIRSDGVRRVHSTIIVDDVPNVRESWTLVDAFGNALVNATTADPGAGDGGPWLLSGMTDRSATGRVAHSYVATFGDSTFLGDIPSPGNRPFASFTYDALGRVLKTTGLDGTATSATVYHPLSTESFDAEDLASGGSHANTPTIVTYNGHRRKVQTFEQSANPPSSVTNQYAYLPTGELSQLTRTYDQGPYTAAQGAGVYIRSLYYDTFGRLVRNVEPNTQFSSDQNKVWRYAYDDAGDLVGTDDARDCGENIFYDPAGRKIAEDFIPCEPTHSPYTAPDLTTGAGTEAFYRYDVGETDQAPENDAAVWKGRLVSVRDRGVHTRFGYDARGRSVHTSRRLAKPGVPDASLDTRYSPYWFEQTAQYDEADRITTASTGADADVLLENGASTVTTEYTARGLVKDIVSSYGVLLTGLTYDEDGSPLTRTRGDVAATTTTLKYEFQSAKRLTHATVARTNAPSAWSTPPAGYLVPPELQQLTLSDIAYSYDRVGNPLSISDLAAPEPWPAGAKPMSRSMQYDDRYRLTNVTYDSHDDTFSDPMPATGPASIATPKRVKNQSFEYDGVGNTIKTSDDQSIYFDRSLGKITNGAVLGATPAMVPNQLMLAGDRTKRADGYSAPSYDKAGNLWTFGIIHPGVTCLSGRTCPGSFRYDWDEVGRLAHATRTELGGHKPAADLTYAYDAGGNRVLTANAITGTYNASIFGSLRLRAATWDAASSAYEHTGKTETAYLPGGARVLYSEDDLPSLSSGKRHIFFSLSDALGSTSLIIDQETSEVVERRSYQAYGAVEADYRPARWKGFREPFGFTGKEEDLEVGLTYFGARYYAPAIGRWISPDPLTIHKLGGDLNPYAYVGGRVYAATDPTGLADNLKTEPTIPQGGGAQPPAQPAATPVYRCMGDVFEDCFDADGVYYMPVITVVGKPPPPYDLDLSSLEHDPWSDGPEIIQSKPPVMFMGEDVGDVIMAPADPRGERKKIWDTFMGLASIAPMFFGALETGPFAAESAPAFAEGSFSVIDWSGYPAGMARPAGALRVLSGEEYAAARALADETNAGIRAANGLEGSGLHIHEIQPVKFGGSPTDMANKMLLPAAEHIGPNGVHPQFWTPLLRWATGGGG